MASKRVRRKAPTRTRSGRSVKSIRTPKVAAGPVTLAQARALAKMSAPVERGARQALAPVSAATVGFERRKLEVKQDLERRRRITEYKATLAIMKKRGVKGLARRTVKSGRAPKAAASRPLQVLAEGDSWFDYPVPLFGGGIIPRLENALGVPVLNLAEAGDQARYMLGVRERKILIEQLTNGCPAGGPWDAMLFSGGGNDIVDNPMVLWIRDFDARLPPAALIHQPRLDAALALVRAGYEDLITLRDRLSPRTRLFFHAYDFVIPDGRGVCFHGPWLKPTYDMRGFPNQASADAVTRILLQQFAAILQSLESSHPNVTFVNGQGTLAPHTSSWHNELHPSQGGFNAFATLFHRALKTAFPTRVL
jgi:hypothetical protein